MKSIKKNLLYGVLVWLIPFVLSIFFVNQDGSYKIDVFLFKSIMILIGGCTGAIFLYLYFKKVTQSFIKEAVIIGLSWVAINWLLDLLILVPMTKMSIASYFYEIGIRYLSILVMSILIGKLLELKSNKL